MTGEDSSRSRCRTFPCYLNDLLACEDFYGGIEPRIGREAYPRHRHRRIAPKRVRPAFCASWIRLAHRVPLEHTRDSDRSRRGARRCSTSTGRSGARRSAAGRTRSSKRRSGATDIHAQEMAADAEEAMGVAAPAMFSSRSTRRTSSASTKIRTGSMKTRGSS